MTDRTCTDVSSNASHIGNINPIRYRSYYYDTETGFYYLNSRYYDPETCRYINADGYVSTGQGIFGNNMFAYCGNNPVNRSDPSGAFWSELWESIKQSFSSLAPAYGACGGVALSDGPLPFGDALAIGAAAILTVGALGYGFYQAVQAPSTSVPKVEEKEDIQTLPPKAPDTVIYRYYSSKEENLAPRPNIDYDGLSFSTRPPRPGVKAVITTIDTVNSTGILNATQNSSGHVTITPTNGTVIEWMQQGQSSIWSQTLSNIVVEWDGGN